MDPGGRAERLMPSMGDGDGSSLIKACVCKYAMSGRYVRQAGWHRRSLFLLSLQLLVEAGVFIIPVFKNQAGKCRLRALQSITSLT